MSAAAVALFAAAFVALQWRSDGSRASVQPTHAGAAPDESAVQVAESSVEPILAAEEPAARRQVDPEPRGTPIVDDGIVLPSALRVSVRLRTSTGESLDEHFEGDTLHGGYASRITVVPTREPLPYDVSDLKLERLRCGTYTRSWAVPNRSFSGMLPSDVSGVIELDRAPPAYANAMLRGRLLASAAIEATTREVVLVVDPDRALATLGGVTFRLMDASTLEPIASAGVKLAETATGEWANPVQWPLEDGRFERQRLPPGPYELQIRLPGFDHLVRSFVVASGRTTDLGELFIEHGSVVEGRVVDGAGNGLGVPLAWSALDGRAGPSFVRMDGSDADGLFVMAELPPRGVMLQIADPEWALDPLTVHTSPGAIVQDVALVARRGTAVLLDARLEDDSEHELVLRRADGLALWSARALGPSSHQVRLVPGGYTLEALRDGFPAVRRAFQVADEPATVELTH